MDQSEYDRRYNRFPWWSNFLLTWILSYVFVFFISFHLLAWWWIHLIILAVAIAGIWHWNPITRWFESVYSWLEQQPWWPSWWWLP